MIRDFTATVRQDIYNVTHLSQSQSEGEKLHSCIRLASALGMGISALWVLSALKSDSLSGVLIAGMMGFISHDLIVISQNDERKGIKQLGAKVRSVIDYAKDRLNGKESAVFAHPNTEGTILRPFWGQLAQNNKLSKAF